MAHLDRRHVQRRRVAKQWDDDALAAAADAYALGHSLEQIANQHDLDPQTVANATDQRPSRALHEIGDEFTTVRVRERVEYGFERLARSLGPTRTNRFISVIANECAALPHPRFFSRGRKPRGCRTVSLPERCESGRIGWSRKSCGPSRRVFKSLASANQPLTCHAAA
jgi:hypothetical protein